MSREPITARGAEQLRRELEDLKSVQRPRVIAAIAEARAHGDLKENAEYHAAKEQQGFIEGRISEIEDRLGRAEIIDPAKLGAGGGGKVVFGATVTLVNNDTDEEVTYQIVGVDEADIKQGRLSFRAPLARALIGREAGDQVVVPAPGGEQSYEILAVEYR
jgi:transcription elongation factor GreA